jgi:hypothetical protein
MSRFIFIFLVGLMPLAAEDARIPGGLSPDGKFEILVRDQTANPNNPEDHEFVLVEVSTKQVLIQIAPGGYAHSLRLEIDSGNLEYPNCGALWSPNSTAFAFNLRGTKRSRSTVVFVQKNGVFQKLELKEQLPSISKELGISGGDRCYFADPARWPNESTLVLKLSGDCVLPSLPREVAGRWFEYEATIDLTNTNPPSIKRLSLKDHNG